MIDLIFAAALMQAAEPCYAIYNPNAPPAGCPHWRRVARGETGDGYLDPASVRRGDGVVDIVLWTVFPREIEDHARSFIARVRLDCARRTDRLLHVTSYDVGGNRVLDQDITEEVSASSGDSPIGALINEFCPRRG
jgi:hypothetical protein